MCCFEAGLVLCGYVFGVLWFLMFMLWLWNFLYLIIGEILGFFVDLCLNFFFSVSDSLALIYRHLRMQILYPLDYEFCVF